MRPESAECTTRDAARTDSQAASGRASSAAERALALQLLSQAGGGAEVSEQCRSKPSRCVPLRARHASGCISENRSRRVGTTRRCPHAGGADEGVAVPSPPGQASAAACTLVPRTHNTQIVAGFTRSSLRRACSAPRCTVLFQTQSPRCASLQAWQRAQRPAAPFDARLLSCADYGMHKSATVRETWLSSSFRILTHRALVRLLGASRRTCR